MAGAFAVCLVAMAVGIYAAMLRSSGGFSSTGGDGGGTTTPPITGPVGLNSTQLAAACVAACGTGVACPQQVALTGVVNACTSCGPGLTLLTTSGTCSASAGVCASTPWCSSSDATVRLVPLHNALVQAAIDAAPQRNASLVGPVYTANMRTNASLWTTTIAPAFGGNTAAASSAASIALNQYLSGKFTYIAANSSTQTPTSWFDDQAGWWRSYLPAYTPGAYASYLTTIKELVPTCNGKRWLADPSTGTCGPPTITT